MQNVLLNAPPGFLIDEIHRKDIHIHEQNKKIEILEMELSRSKQKIEELQTQLAKCNDGGYKSAQGRYWSVDEHQRFLEGLKRYGAKDVKSISQHVGTRNATQVRTHAQKYFLRLEKEKGEEQNVNSPNSDETSFNNNKEKDDESDVQEDISSDKDPNPNNDNNTVQNEASQGEDRSPSGSATPPTTDKAAIKKSPTKSKPAPAKSKKKGKRKASTMTMQLGESTATNPSTEVHIKNEQNFTPFKPAPHLPSAPLTSFLPAYGVLNSHSNMMGYGSNVALCNKIIAETSETILYNMKHWTAQDYALFVEGLISVQEEKDNNSKCVIIRDKFLPQFPLEDIMKCYSLLQNVAMKETQQTPTMPYYMVSPIAESGTVLEMDPKRMRIISPTPDMSHFGSPFQLTDSGIIRNPSVSSLYHTGAFPIGHVRYPSVQYNYPIGSQGHSESFFQPAFPPLMEHNSTSGTRLVAHSNDLRLGTNESEYDSHY